MPAFISRVAGDLILLFLELLEFEPVANFDEGRFSGLESTDGDW